MWLRLPPYTAIQRSAAQPLRHSLLLATFSMPIRAFTSTNTTKHHHAQFSSLVHAHTAKHYHISETRSLLLQHHTQNMLSNAQVAHRLGMLAAQSYRYSQALWTQQCSFAAAASGASSNTATSTTKSTYNVPEGHHNSDLSSTACHIGLGRRRDLTMRQDLRLWDGDKPLTLAEVFQVCVCVKWVVIGCAQR